MKNTYLHGKILENLDDGYSSPENNNTIYQEVYMLYESKTLNCIEEFL
jgi:hypothetical protein